MSPGHEQADPVLDRSAQQIERDTLNPQQCAARGNLQSSGLRRICVNG